MQTLSKSEDAGYGMLAMQLLRRPSRIDKQTDRQHTPIEDAAFVCKLGAA